MNLQETLDKLNDLDLNDLDFNNVGSWPIAGRIAIFVVVFLLVMLLGYQFHITSVLDSHKRAVAQENTLKESFQMKAYQAANLDSYRLQMLEVQNTFDDLMEQMPSDTEVPGLLDDITRTARTAGLQIEQIRLQNELITQYYIELPISISVKGGYHEMGSFVSGVASLSRIVTLHDLSILPNTDGSLTMDILAKTYRYNDQEGL